MHLQFTQIYRWRTVAPPYTVYQWTPFKSWTIIIRAKISSTNQDRRDNERKNIIHISSLSFIKDLACTTPHARIDHRIRWLGLKNPRLAVLTPCSPVAPAFPRVSNVTHYLPLRLSKCYIKRALPSFTRRKGSCPRRGMWPAGYVR